jgi:hypothetical protein
MHGRHVEQTAGSLERPKGAERYIMEEEGDVTSISSSLSRSVTVWSTNGFVGMASAIASRRALAASLASVAVG